MIRRSLSRTFRQVALPGLFSLALLAVGPLSAQESLPVPGPAADVRVPPMPAPPELSARSYLLVDFDSGQTLVEKNADEPMEPASITKLVSTYVIFEALERGDISLDDEVVVSERAWRKGGSKMFIEVGDRVSVDNLLKGVIVQSGNDATIALAEHVSGSVEAFVQEMNATARRLGMDNSYFLNTTGWPAEGHVMSARDIAKVMAAMIRDFPDQYARYSQKEFTWNEIRQHNRNRLLWRDPSVDGGKTGHTSSAGYCLVASAQREATRMIAVVLGTDSDAVRTEQTQTLLNFGFRFYETLPIRQAGEVLGDARVWKGAVSEVPVGLAEDLSVTVARNQRNQVGVSLVIDGPLIAPLQAGTAVGRLQVTADEQMIAERPVVALESVEQGGLVGRTIDGIRLMFE
ncbi:MAG: D-alanyl-D-alanine carboxypeptidase family protein [Halothiobacillaceae bacterium]